MNTQRTLTLILALLALVLIFPAPVLALDTPAVSYNPATQGLTLSFTIPTMFPPTGFDRWEVDILVNGTWETYADTHASRVVNVTLAAPLDFGNYFIQAAILDVDGKVLDSVPMFDWTYSAPFYQADLPRVVVGGDEQWDTGLALSCHNQDGPVSVFWYLYAEGSGSLVASGEVVIAPHASPAFNFAPYVQGYLAKEASGIFTGSAVIRAHAPVAMTYQCRPYAPGTAPGIAFGMVLQRVE